MFFEMLTGRRPFDARDMNGLLEGHLKAPIPRLGPELGRLQPVIDGLLAKDPDDRFQSTEELLLGVDWDG
jgi:serine/threonine-protein kinase PpkA